MQLELEMTGTTPLVMHNAQLSDPLNRYAKAIAEISAKRAKTEADHIEMSRLEFLGGLYVDADGKTVVMPGENIKRCLVNAAKATKEGKPLERSLLLTEQVTFPLVYIPLKTPEELWNDKSHVSRRSVKVGQSRIMRTRPVFFAWNITSRWLLENMNLANFERIAKRAGDVEGLGDHRSLGSGRFSVRIGVVK
jgi:hypothetical protein